MKKHLATLAFVLQVFFMMANPYNSSRWLPRYNPPTKQETDYEQKDDHVETQENVPQKPQEQPSLQEDKANKISLQPQITKPNFDKEIEVANTALNSIKNAGFSVQNNEDLLVRGQVARTTNVYIDGILSNDPLTGEFDFGLLDCLEIESIKIVEGDVFSPYNHCASIYITTKAQKGFKLESVTTSNFAKKAVWFSDNYAKASYGFSLGKVNFTASVAGQYNQNKFYYKPLGINKYEQKYSLWQDKYNSIGTAVQFFFPAATGKIYFRDTNFSTDYLASAYFTFGKTNAGTSVQHTKIEGGGFSSVVATASTNIMLPLGFCVEPKANFELGHIETKLGGQFDVSCLLLTNAKWTTNKKIFFEVAITPKIYFSDFGIIPSGASSLTLGIKNHGIQLKAGLLYCKPNLQQLYWQDGVTNYVGNPNLKSESGWHTELDYSYTGTFLKISSAFYFTRVVDSIHAVPFKDAIRYENSSKGVFFGGTMSVDIFPCERFSLIIKYENVNPFITEDLKVDSKDKQIMWTYRHRVWAKAACDLGFACISLSGEYVGKRPSSNTNQMWIPQYFLAKAGVEVPFRWGKFSTDFTTSFGKPWQETTLEPMPENQLSFQIQIHP